MNPSDYIPMIAEYIREKATNSPNNKVEGGFDIDDHSVHVEALFSKNYEIEQEGDNDTEHIASYAYSFMLETFEIVGEDGKNIVNKLQFNELQDELD